MPLRDQLKPQVEQRFPGFEEHYKLAHSRYYAFSAVDCRRWYSAWEERVLAAAGGGAHLPVFRASHGEFIMALGYQRTRRKRAEGLARYLRRSAGFALWELRRRLSLSPPFRSGSGDNSFEVFTAEELPVAREVYTRCMRAISHEGILALALHDNPGYAEYFPAYFDWLDRNKIRVTPENYVPFYSVYVLLNGPGRRPLFAGRRVLIITSMDEDKRARLQGALGALGARAVQCYGVSPQKAMFDVIDLQRVEGAPEVILVGAGVGAASVLDQVRPLRALAIDAGFAIDALAYPDLRWNRPFCIPDEEWDPERIRFL